jgi:hypothetical protein
LQKMLRVNEQALKFDAFVGVSAIPSQTFSLTTHGGGLLLEAAVSDDADWLSVVPLLGPIPMTFSVSVSAEGLGPGMYTAMILITEPGYISKTVPVTLVLQQKGVPLLRPALQTDVALMAFESLLGDPPPLPKSLGVSACLFADTSSLTVFARGSHDWFTLKPSLGRVSGSGSAQFLVSVDTTNQTPGIYYGTLTCSDTAGVAVPTTLTVQLHVLSVPILAVDKQSLKFSAANGGSSVAGQTLTITTDNGTNSVPWQAAVDAPWAQLSPTQGMIPSTTVVSVVPNGLDVGIYTAALVFGSTLERVAPKIVPLTLVLGDGAMAVVPVLNVDRTEVVFQAARGQNSAPQQVSLSLSNVSASSSVTVCSSDNFDWLKVSPALSVLTTTSPAAFVLMVDTTGLSNDLYFSSVTFSDSSNTAAAQTISVKLILGS